MNGYVFVLNKKQENVSHKKKIYDIFTAFLDKNVNVSEYIHGNVSFYTFSNEAVTSSFVLHDNFHFGLSGYLTIDEISVFDWIVESKNRDSLISELGGVFSLALYEKNNKTLSVWNNITGVEPVYWCETDNNIVVGTKAILVHMLGYNLENPEYDVNAFTSFLSNGFYCNDLTPFKGVKVLGTNRKIVVANQKLSISPIDDFFSKLYIEEPDHHFLIKLPMIFWIALKF